MFRSALGRAVLAGCLAVAGTSGIGAQQSQPRDPRPNAPGPATAREQQLQAATVADPANLENWMELARLQEERRAFANAEATYKTALDRTGGARGVAMAAAGFFSRIGEFDKAVASLRDAAARNSNDAAVHHLLATFYFERVQRDPTLAAADKLTMIEAGTAAAERALVIDPDFMEAIVYKSLFLRSRANVETDTTRRAALIAEAEVLRTRAMELQKQRAAAMPVAPGAPPPPPPPPPPGFDTYDGPQPIRVGGNIKAPAKIRDVRPVYPQEALDARASGVVILEAIVDPEGNVKTARVVRSIPILDQAAIDAVKQWQFVPTLLNGVAVPVIMTVTVNFTLQ
jgi:protein TonB